MRSTHLLVALVIVLGVAVSPLSHGHTLKSRAQPASDALSELSEFYIGVAGAWIITPDDLLVGYAQLEWRDVSNTKLDAGQADANRLQSEWISSLHLRRVLEIGGSPYDSHQADEQPSSVDSLALSAESTELTMEIVVSLAAPSWDDRNLDMVQVPSTVTFEELRKDIQSGNRAFDWLDDAPYRPGLPLASTGGGLAQAVVAIPFTFPNPALYILYSRSEPDFLAVYQAVAVPEAPGCGHDFALSIHSGICEPMAGNVAPPKGPSTEGADVIALISSKSIDLKGRFELGRETWAIVNTTADARSFAIFQIQEDATIDQSMLCLPKGGGGDLVLAQLTIDQQYGLTEFSGSDPRKLIVTLGPGFYAIVSTLTQPDGGIEATGCYFELVA